jgi:hypothetical protein
MGGAAELADPFGGTEAKRPLEAWRTLKESSSP